jgi:hypothetical protein
LIAPIKERLRSDQQPAGHRSKIIIFEPRDWYAIDWFNPDQDELRHEILSGKLLDLGQRAKLCGDALMVTYWAYT